jgi:hypothetical protein
MRVFARVVPTVTGRSAMSVPSGLVRVGRTRETLDSQALPWCVRLVRRIFYCLTYTHARDAFSINTRDGYLFPWDIEKNRTSRTMVLTYRNH